MTEHGPPAHGPEREPDPRFTLANERTFLAWNRTALALVGGGLAAGQLVDFASTVARLAAGLLPVALGAVIAVVSLRRWRAVEHALRTGDPLPAPALAPLLARGVTLLAVVVAAIVILDG